MAKSSGNPFAEHLEFLGYAVDPVNDAGWQLARHDRRWSIYLRVGDAGTRVYGHTVAGKAFGDARLEFLEALNRANDDAAVARFCVVQDEDGDVMVRARATFTGAYERRAFGAFLDAWHDDIGLLMRLPALPQEPEAADEDDGGVPAAKALVS